MSPYIVTTKQRVPNWDGVGDAPLMRGFRRAVATLEEARTLLIRSEHGGSLSTALLDTLPGTVGPLPDETTISVEQTTWLTLANVAFDAGVFASGDASIAEHGNGTAQREILDAYNARQA
jgi:hypothetical protein